MPAYKSHYNVLEEPGTIHHNIRYYVVVARLRGTFFFLIWVLGPLLALVFPLIFEFPCSFVTFVAAFLVSFFRSDGGFVTLDFLAEAAAVPVASELIPCCKLGRRDPFASDMFMNRSLPLCSTIASISSG